MKKYLYLPMEIKCREFPAKIILALKAALRGFDVFAGETSAIQALAATGPQGVYLGTAAVESHRRLYEGLQQCGQRIVSMDEEGLVYYNKDNFQKHRINIDTINMIEAFAVWGQHHYDLTMGKHAFRNVFLAGNPRLEILKIKYRELFSRQVAEIKKIFPNYVLINTNFGAANHFLGEGHHYNIVNSLVKLTEDDVLFQHAKVAHVKNTMEHFIRLINEIAQRHPNTDIIIRPHPSENLRAWQKIDKGKVRVIQEGSVIPWLLGAQCLIQQNCTTAIEAMVLGTPVLSFIPCYDTRFDDALPNWATHTFSASADVIHALTAVLEGKGLAGVSEQCPTHKMPQEDIGNHVAFLGSKENSINALLGIIEKVARPTQQCFGRLERLQMLIGMKAQENKEYAEYFKQKFNSLSFSEIGHVHHVMNRIENGRYEPVKIEEVLTDTLFSFTCG